VCFTKKNLAALPVKRNFSSVSGKTQMDDPQCKGPNGGHTNAAMEMDDGCVAPRYNANGRKTGLVPAL
jgi:hypothetical protein